MQAAVAAAARAVPRIVRRHVVQQQRQHRGGQQDATQRRVACAEAPCACSEHSRADGRQQVEPASHASSQCGPWGRGMLTHDVRPNVERCAPYKEPHAAEHECDGDEHHARHLRIQHTPSCQDVKCGDVAQPMIG